MAETAKLQRKLPGITLVTDEPFTAADAWGVHERGGQSPIPSTFVVDETGRVTWRKLDDAAGDWPTFGQLDTALRK